MSAQSLFSKKNIQSKQLDSRRDLLEELNLPPALISFVRKNTRSLQIGFICMVVLVLAWVFFDYYTEMQEKKGNSLLATGLQTDSVEQRVQVLENVINDYGRTDAARWSKIELAHMDYNEGRFEAAIAKYKEVLDALPADNSLVPLTRLNLAQSYEKTGQYDLAIAQYNFLKKATGFSNQAYWALGRIYLAKEDPAQARSNYEELLGSLDATTSDPALISRVEAKMAALGSGGEPVDLSQPEESKE